MNIIRQPRSYWTGISDAELRRARRDWIVLGGDMPWTPERVAEIDDELARREARRARLAAA